MGRGMRFGFLCAVILCLWAAPSHAKEAPSTGEARQQVLEYVHKLDDLLLIQRIDAINNLANVADPTLIKDFKITEKLIAYVKNTSAVEAERQAALEALIRMHGNGIDIKGLLDMLTDIVRDTRNDTRTRDSKPNSIPLRIKTLGLLSEVAKQSNNTFEKKSAYTMLTTLWENSKRSSARETMPITLRAALVEAIAGFPDPNETMEIIMEALKEKEPMIKSAGLRGLYSLLRSKSIVDSRLMNDLEKEFILSMKESSDPEGARIILLDILDLLVRNIEDTGKSYRFSPTLRASVEKLFADGDDEESIAAGRFLLRAGRKDPTIVDTFLQVSSPAEIRAKARDIDTVDIYYQIQIEMLIRISNDERLVQRAKPQVEKIIERFTLLLAPDANTRAGVPDKLRNTLIFGMRLIPIQFDRTQPVEILIQNLAFEGNLEQPSMPLVKEIRSSLLALTGRDFVKEFRPPVEAEAGTEAGSTSIPDKVTIPDVKSWMEWFATNKEYLKPGKTPWSIQ